MTEERPAIPEGLSETRFGLRYYVPGVRLLVELVDLRRKSGDLWAEMTVRCRLEGIVGQLDGDRMRQGKINLSSLTTRTSWARALKDMTPEELNTRIEWGNLLERVAQEALDYERKGALHGGVLTGDVADDRGIPWAAYPILPDGDSATLYSRGGAGKTSLVVTLAMSMGLGRSLIPGIRVDRSYRVAILDWETSQTTANKLIHSIAGSYNVDVPSTIWYEPMEQPFERSLQKVASVLERHRADLVVIDSVQMAMLSGSDYSDAAESITRLHQGLRRLGVWGLLIDHVASDDVRSQKAAIKPYGSVFKSNIARHTINLHVTERTGETSKAYLLCAKSNLMRDRWAMEGVFERSDTSLRWDFGDMDYELYERLITGARDTDDDRPVQSAGKLADRIAAVIEELGPMSVPSIAHALAMDTPRDRAKIRTTMHRYKDAFKASESGTWSMAD